ncbi:MAG: phenylalanine--tRNA ligase subunit beta [Candidatus Pacebacteria bacterium]|nr:phenylalanine--tRNA ligase subunit beta [Candidatus Paceibacterota bacterium]
MKYSYNWLQSFFKEKLPSPEKLASLLTLHFAEVEEIKKEKGDCAISIDVRPNRAADCLSHLGIAREIGAISNLKLKTLNYKPIEDKKLKTKDFVSVEIKDKEACLRYTARVITGVKVDSSPKWMQERLETCGLRPINSVVDITNYVMLETGQPLHAFDADKLKGKKIIVRRAKEGEKLVTLDDQKVVLDKDILIIADAENPLALAGIKGGKGPEIDSQTRNVVLESANFDYSVIRKTSRKINLKTDASLRFEHGLDPNLTEYAANRASILIQDITQGKVAQGIADVYPRRIISKKIRLKLEYARSLLGKNISSLEMIKILKILGFKTKQMGKDVLDVTVPTIRRDVLLQEDLIEDIGRIYGYEKIEPVFPASSLIPPFKNLDIYWEDMVKDSLKQVGFNEVYNYSFFGDKEADIFGYKNELIEVRNPISSEQKYLRAILVPGLLKNIEKNINYEKEIKIFELGNVFTNPKQEKKQLTGLILEGDFYQLKGIVDFILNNLGISNISYREYNFPPQEIKTCVWHSQRYAEIEANGEKIGFLGELSKEVVSKFGIKEKIVSFDIDFAKLTDNASEEQEYRPISKFPAAVRDIAILVPLEVKADDVLDMINSAGGMLVRNVDLFDIYEGEELPEGKKNLAFHIIFQSEEKTLNSEEVDGLQDKIIKFLELNPDFQVRKQI